MVKGRGRKGRGSGILRFAMTIIVLALVMTATIGFLYYYMDRVLRQNIRDGFKPSDLEAPIDLRMPFSIEEPPIIITPGPPEAYSLRVFWPVNGTDGKLEAYPGIGAMINLSLENNGPTTVYVERARVSTGWGSMSEWKVGKYVRNDSRRWMRHLDLKVPLDTPPEEQWDYTVSLTVLVQGRSSWTRVQNVEFDRSTLNVRSLLENKDPLRVRKNWKAYYDSIVPKVREDLHGLSDVLNKTSFNRTVFTVQSLADLQLWVLSKVEYESDRDGRDEWLSPLECLRRGRGDCEDFAILYGAAVALMGGSARVIVTRDHAFNAIYIGKDGTILSSLSERYDVTLPFQLLEDDLGMWVLIEPQSFLIAGWFPLGIMPVAGSIRGQSLYGGNGLSWNYYVEAPIYVVDIYIH